MIPENRRVQILEALSTSGYLSVESLARMLFVSIPTMRRDLAQLEKEGSIKRTHGGASYVSENFSVWPFALRNKTYVQEKIAIGSKAVRLLKEGDSVFIDSSSTCLCFAKAIPTHMKLTVLTNAIPIAQALSAYKNIRVEIPGGQYAFQHASVFGDEACAYIAQRHADFCFLSCGGIDVHHGVTNRSQLDISVKKAMVKNAAQTVLLMDHMKIGASCYYKVFDFADMDYLVSDESIGDELAERCREDSVQIIT